MGLLTLLSESRAQIWASWGWSSLTLFALISVTIITSHVVYNLYFHPLSKIPGPWYAVISDLWGAYTVVSGNGPRTIRALHEKYGEVVRLAPNELSFSSAAAWRDIYQQSSSRNFFTKDPKFYMNNKTNRAQQLVNIIDPEQHAQSKKVISPAFSPKALLEQEDVVLEYADMLMVAIVEESGKGLLNMNECYTWVTFDVLGELAFGESFSSVKTRKTDEWISTVLNMASFIAWTSAINRVSPLLQKLLGYLIPPSVRRASMNHMAKSRTKIQARVKRGEGERKDFCSYLFELKEQMNLNEWNIAAYSNLMILAGSETTATALSALTYWLCRTPRVYEKLKVEVRSRYRSSSEITSLSATFPYMTAVIHEMLRIFPPVPMGMPRVAPEGGETVDGVFVPGGTTVSVHAWSSTHSAKNFKDPDSFIPERWLDPANTDNHSASNPWLLGPRSCIGQNMAWMEMRILIAKMVFLLDYELVDDNLDWDRDSASRVLWQKPDLWIKVTPRDVS